ncbi:MAG: twin-arginine translocase subunit TatC [Actinomycetia bacterium]|nr:twin-arginine translocase subunit TatC [Actinomycetes bacterium]
MSLRPRRRREGSRRPPTDDEGRMPLVEHLRELRSRLGRSFLAIFLGAVVGWFYYDEIITAILRPFNAVIAEAQAEGRDVKPILSGITDAFTLQLQVALMAGIVLAAPIWLYQLWRFVTPGLHRHERRWAYVFVGAAFPLFLLGMGLAYLFLPQALRLLLGFTPESVGNYVPIKDYISFVLRMMLVFGLGFLAPILVVVLNLVGILSAHRFASWWRYVIMITLVFAAVATPTGDPITMAVFAGPILVLLMGAFGICWVNDRRRARRDTAEGFAGLSDDEASPLDLTPEPLDLDADDVHDAGPSTR